MAYSQTQIDELLKKYGTLADAGGGAFLAGKMNDPSISNPEAELLNWGRSEVPDFRKSFGGASDYAGRVARGQAIEGKDGVLQTLGLTSAPSPEMLGAVNATVASGGFGSGALSQSKINEAGQIEMIQPQTTPQSQPTNFGAGSLITGPSQLAGLTEADLARTTGANIYRRDLAKEQQMLGAYSASYGAPKNDQDWLKFHDYVYEGKGVKTPTAETKNDLGTLGSENLGETTQLDFKTSGSQNIPNIQGLGVEGQKIQALYDLALQKSNELLGEAKDKAELEKTAGIGEMTATQKDLSVKLKQLQNKALAIPLELESASQRRGITGEILNRQTAEGLRQNAIEALTVSSLIEASSNNILSAQSLIESALEEKYGPIREELNTSLFNIELAQKSPAFSAEEKAILDAQTTIKEAQKRALDKKEDTEKTIKNIAIQVAATNRASATDLDSILKAKDEVSAMSIASKFLVEPVVSGGGVGTAGIEGVYTPGADVTVDSWAERIQSGQAKITDIPASQASLRNKVTVALGSMGNTTDGKPTVTEMGKNALATAQGLMTKFTLGQGTSAVGKSSLLSTLGYGLIPGTQRANFVTDFKSLKDQLSLEGVKYLKGQGQVSDAERAMLASAVTKLNLSQSESEFKSTLQGIIDKLSGTSNSNVSNVVTAPDGEQIEITD